MPYNKQGCRRLTKAHILLTPERMQLLIGMSISRRLEPAHQTDHVMQQPAAGQQRASTVEQIANRQHPSTSSPAFTYLQRWHCTRSRKGIVGRAARQHQRRHRLRDLLLWHRDAVPAGECPRSAPCTAEQGIATEDLSTFDSAVKGPNALAREDSSVCRPGCCTLSRRRRHSPLHSIKLAVSACR